MYLDKALRLHTLFQAICRRNRCWSNPITGPEKLHGLIVDTSACETRSRKPYVMHILIVAAAVAWMQMAWPRSSDALETTLERFAGIDRANTSFAALMAAQEPIPLGDARDDFADDFLRVQGMWEFLDPSPVTAARRVDYRWLAQVYESVRPAGTSDALLWQRLVAKTLDLVHGHITEVRVTESGLDEEIVDADTIEAIRQLALPDSGVDLDGNEPMTVGEALDTIEARIQRRLAATRNHPVHVHFRTGQSGFVTGSSQASSYVEFLREYSTWLSRSLLQSAPTKKVTSTRSASFRDPNVGALTQIFHEYAPADAPIIIKNGERHDTIVRQVRFTGWSQTQDGDRTVRCEVRLTLREYGLPTTGELFDHAYAYIRENY